MCFTHVCLQVTTGLCHLVRGGMLLSCGQSTSATQPVQHPNEVRKQQLPEEDNKSLLI